MEKRIVFKNVDGTCGIIIPSPSILKDVLDDKTGEVIQAAITLEDIAKRDVPEGLEWRICDASDIPSDRAFRAAWTDDNPSQKIDVNMQKAREIHMNNIRQVRNEKLKELDVEQLKGVNVLIEKQSLRDLPLTFDLTLANTANELKSLWPQELK